jgi:hypothetical protein
MGANATLSKLWLRRLLGKRFVKRIDIDRRFVEMQLPFLQTRRLPMVSSFCVADMLCHNAPALMPFFFVVPIWLFCVLCGIALLCFRRFRRTGVYAINISTAATVVSFILSTTVLFVSPRIGMQRMGRWSGIALMGAYVIAIGVGALIGALGGFLLTRKLLPDR